MARNAQEAALALHRFGFGPRAGLIEGIADDPRGALIAELDRPGAGQITNPDLPTSGAANRAVFEYNAESIGPNSIAGVNRDHGLNENLAREILELHTLGVRTTYTQDDVTNFAKVLTGWTIRQTVSDPDHGGEFVYIKRAHEPGPQTVIGKEYDDPGTAQGRAVLADLARH